LIIRLRPGHVLNDLDERDFFERKEGEKIDRKQDMTH
jgi:hypothetical protein